MTSAPRARAASSLSLLTGLVMLTAIAGLSWYLWFRPVPALPSPTVSVSAADLLAPDENNRSSEWLNYGRTLNGHRFSPLTQINRNNVEDLQLAWIYRFPPMPAENGLGGDQAAGPTKIEATAIMANGALFFTASNNRLVALDARTGRLLWSHSEPMPKDVDGCCGAVNRGVAVHEGLVVWKTFDNRMQALDAATGQLVWETLIEDYRLGSTSTGAPMAVNGKILTGISGGSPGFIAAYDADSGDLLWKTYTAPEPGSEGAETWGGATPLGASPWTTGTFDPDLGLVFWGVGNPSPPFDGDARPGDNLFSNCIVALDLETGAMRWFYQAVPHDVWDYDAIGTPILVDRDISGQSRKLVFQANRAGYSILLDRETGAFIYAEPYLEKITWATGYDEEGRAKIVPEQVTTAGVEPIAVSPDYPGGSNWPPPAYDAAQGLVYFHYKESNGLFPAPDSGYIPVPGEITSSGVVAVDVDSGKPAWRFVSREGTSIGNGLLATAGGLIFVGDKSSNLLALDSTTGDLLWQYQVAGTVNAVPMTYKLDGVQILVIPYGSQEFAAFRLPPSG